jgi:glycosyltransferase involved in cell wall biosynthesis
MTDSDYCKNKVILHIFNDVRKSGAERMLHSATKIMPEIGQCSKILGFGSQHTFAEELQKLGIQVISMDGNAKSIKAILKFILFMYKTKVDVVHIHIEQAFLVIVCIAKIIKPKTRIVRTVHGDHRQFGFLRFRRKIMARIAILLFKVKWIACSSYISKIESDVLGKEVDFIENWASVNADEVQPMEDISRYFSKSFSNSPKLLLIGNCDSNKNHVEILKNERVLKKYQVIHVGSTFAASDEEKILLDDSNVFNLDIEASLAYQICDLVVLPSIREAMSVVAIECLIRGKEILVTREWGLWWANQFESVDSDLIQGYWLIKVQDDLESIRERFSPLLGITKYRRIYFG